MFYLASLRREGPGGGEVVPWSHLGGVCQVGEEGEGRGPGRGAAWTLEGSGAGSGSRVSGGGSSARGGPDPVGVEQGSTAWPEFCVHPFPKLCA